MKLDKETLICQKLIEMLEEKSFFDISVTEFVSFAGISRSLFYLYFSSMYDVLERLENDFMNGLLPEDKLLSTTSNSKNRTIDASILSKAEYIRKNKKLLKALTSDNGDPAFVASMINRYKRIIRSSMEGQTQYSELEKKLIAEYISAGQVQTLKWWSRHYDEVDVVDAMLAIESITTSFLQGKK